MKQRAFKSIILIMLVVLLFGELPSPLPSPTAAHAQGSPANAVIALFNIIGAARRRNRVYREARATQREMEIQSPPEPELASLSDFMARTE